MRVEPHIDRVPTTEPDPAPWRQRPKFLVALVLILAFGFWFAHLQWWWKANDDSVHQYFNSLKIGNLELTRDLNAQALDAMLEGRMEAKRIDRLELRVDVTYNWLLTSLSIRGIDLLSERLAGEAIGPEDFPAHLMATEMIGFLLAFSLALGLLVFVVSRYFDRVFVEALAYAIAALALLAMVRQVLSSEFVVLLVIEAGVLLALFRVVRGTRFIVLLALMVFFTAYGILDQVIRSELFGDNLDAIVGPKGGIFQFVVYSLDTFVYPKRCCSPLGYFARSNFNLLMILLFALRWSNRYGASYALIAALSLIHVAQSGLVLFLLLGVDIWFRPGVLLQRRVALAVGLAAAVFVARQGAWPSHAWLSENAVLVGGAVILALLGLLAVKSLAGRIDARRLPLLGPVMGLRARLLAAGPVPADLVAVGVAWLGLALSLMVLVKVLGPGRLQEMSYLSQLTLLGVPNRILSLLQAPVVFGVILYALTSWRPPAAISRRNLSKWALRLACLVALVLWAGNLFQVAGGGFPGKQLARIEARHEQAVLRPPGPRRDFSEANMYYLMALYTRTGHFVANGFFGPVERTAPGP